MAAPPEKTLKDLNGKWVMVRHSRLKLQTAAHHDLEQGAFRRH